MHEQGIHHILSPAINAGVTSHCLLIGHQAIDNRTVVFDPKLNWAKRGTAENPPRLPFFVIGHVSQPSRIDERQDLVADMGVPVDSVSGQVSSDEPADAG